MLLFYRVVKTMNQQEFCRNCTQKQNCGEVYRQLGSVKGPSVLFNVIIAFLLPLVVFIGSLAVFEAILAKTIETKPVLTVVSVVPAFLAASVCVVIAKVINRQLRQQKHSG